MQYANSLIVLREPWRAHPLAWIHRAEAEAIAGELGAPLRTFSNQSGLLRLSDPVMLRATETLTRAGIPYTGPGAAALRLCYDKLAATERVAGAGIDCPATHGLSSPVIVKPRRGSDSLGVRIVHAAPPGEYLIQELVRGRELTVAVLHDVVGAPLEIDLPPGTPYSFLHKYLLRIAALLGVDWGARIDFIYDDRRDRLCFLECDAAPLVGVGSAFAASLLAAGVPRAEQLRRLILGACS